VVKNDRAGGIKVSRKIGEGVFGEVYRATHDGSSVALKVHPLSCVIDVMYSFTHVRDWIYICQRCSHLHVF